MSNQAMEQARAQLAELIEAARAGTIIPARLAGQLEALEQSLLRAETEADEAEAARPVQPADDAQQIIVDNAEFMRTAVHELRTPMTSIRGYADMLSNPAMAGELSDMQNQLLQVIRANSRRMESLLSDMSYINKVRSGTLQVNKKMDMFKNIAQMAEKQLRPLAEELQREFVVDVPQGMPLLTTDGELLAHALVKLAENGLRYSPAQGGRVTISGRGEGERLVITIEDNGIGMTEEEIARLGELFFRSENDIVREHKGSGLGVAIAFGLVKTLGGEIDVTSQPGQGTRFVLTFQSMS
jgi:signal transduction histidine kinase